MAIITNQELRDLWADAAKIKEAISSGKVAVADAAVLAKLEAMRVLLAGTLSTADAAVLAKLSDLESKLDMILNGTTPAAVELKGHLEALVAKDNATSAKQDSMIAALGAQSDAEATSDGSIVGLLKRLRTLIGDSLVTLGSAIGSKAQLIAGSDGTNARALKTAADGTLLTQLTGSNVIKGAVQNVPTAGTRVQLPSFACREVTIIALRTNNGRIYVGGSDVSNTVYGADLGPEDAITIPVSNANMIYIDASVSGEGVSYVAV